MEMAWSRWLVLGWACWCVVACGPMLPPDDRDNVELTSTDEQSDQEIQGGRSTSGYAAVGMLLSANGVLCTGTLIAKQVVLTAAHCVVDPPVAFYLGRAPVVTSNDPWGWTQDNRNVHAVAATETHPDYVPALCGDSPDLALVLLEQRVRGVSPLSPIKRFHTKPGRVCTAVGYGVHGKGSSETSGRKRSATVRVVDVTGDDVVVEAVSGQADHGDSGGPLLCSGRIHGVTSCGPDGGWRYVPVTYSRVDGAAQWIETVRAIWGA